MFTKKHNRVAAIHDLSGFGRCSLSVILPVMSVMGVQVCPIPTAVLSTHTGGFGEVAKVDLTDYISETLNHYKKLKLQMDCVYTGYLGSVKQVLHCQEYFKYFEMALKVVDPVMGDGGKLYHSFTREMVDGICKLVESADIITPNMTEASIILGEDMPTDRLTTADARKMLAKLSSKGPKKVVVTGVVLATGEYANICYDSENATYWKSCSQHLPVSYPGTGDIFAAVLTAAIMCGDSLPMAVDRATRFVELAIKTTYSYSTPTREGVMMEEALKWLITSLSEIPQGYETL